MANIQIKKCDKCGAEARNDTQKEICDAYHTITLEVSSRGKYDWALSQLLLCEACLLKIGAKKATRNNGSRHDPDLRERLYNIFAELIEEIGGQR